ncbi:MAG: hypothetical protein AABY22_36090 [Nanoarchaeota archaeon]
MEKDNKFIIGFIIGFAIVMVFLGVNYASLIGMIGVLGYYYGFKYLKQRKVLKLQKIN